MRNRQKTLVNGDRKSEPNFDYVAPAVQENLL
uniref:Uncharacterized protein n=1 Tax=Romanomermis culicivorax TaxID=13658 RepID=A0A915IY36_ROMCU